jgi:hypothetical protein
MRSNGFLGSHTNLNRGHPGLGENALGGVLVAEVSFASLSPEVINNETPENVQGLFRVGETAGVVGEVPKGIVVALKGGLSKEGERLRDVKYIGCLPLFPDSLVGFPGVLRLGAFEQVVLR